MNTATFAGGCFWCVEHDLRAIPGVADAISGYARAGNLPVLEKVPSYEDHEGFREAVQVSYDASQVSFRKLCQFFLDHIDPTDAGGQFYDRGEAYKTAIYVKNEEEEQVARDLIKELEDSKLFAPLPIVVEVLPEGPFFKAEEYHQEYAEKNPLRYGAYSQGSGRVQFVANACAVREEKHIQWKNVE